MHNNTLNQVALIDQFFKQKGKIRVYISDKRPDSMDCLVIDLRNSHQTVTLLSRVEQLQPGSIFHPEDFLHTFDERKHRYLVMSH